MDNDYNFSTASIEIIVALAAAFIAGALLCYLLRLLGLCCRRPSPKTETNTRQVHLDVNQTTAGAGIDSQAGFPTPKPPVVERTPIIEPQPPAAPAVAAAETSASRLSVGGGAYEADINTLLRSGSPDTSSIPLPQNNAGSSSFAERARETLGETIPPAPPAAATSSTVRNDLIMPDDDHIDDLKKLEGIGPRIETLLNRYEIKSYARLATMDRDRLRDILEAGGNEFKMHEPKSWPYQAELAAKENWDRLREYQEFLLEGRSG